MKKIYVYNKIERSKKNGEKYIDKDGYIYIRINSYIILEHRYIWSLHNGKIPKNMIIHHKNGNKSDNTIENLECLSIEEHGRVHRKRIVYPSGAIKVIKIMPDEVQILKNKEHNKVIRLYPLTFNSSQLNRGFDGCVTVLK